MANGAGTEMLNPSLPTIVDETSQTLILIFMFANHFVFHFDCDLIIRAEKPAQTYPFVMDVLL